MVRGSKPNFLSPARARAAWVTSGHNRHLSIAERRRLAIASISASLICWRVKRAPEYSPWSIQFALALPNTSTGVKLRAVCEGTRVDHPLLTRTRL